MANHDRTTEPADYYGDALKEAKQIGHPCPEVLAAIVADISETMEAYLAEWGIYSSE